MAKIYGNGLMLIPGRGTFMPFSGGMIVTDDPLVIQAGKLNGFRVVEEKQLDLITEQVETVEQEAPKRGRKKGYKNEQ